MNMCMVIVLPPPPHACGYGDLGYGLLRAGLWLYMSSKIMNAYGYGYSTLSPMHMVMEGLMASWVIMINEYGYGYSKYSPLLPMHMVMASWVMGIYEF